MTATTSETAVVRRETTDRQLLDRFVTLADQEAFAELVGRHGTGVWTVCRRVLGQEQDAEDAFQAVFLILGRKARAIRKRESVGSWLHGVALRTALKLRRGLSRRRARETHAAAASPPPQPPEQAAALELQRFLDEEVARLPEKYRAPFVLCCLEGMTRPEAARELSWSEGTVSSRLAHARDILHTRLAQRGITLSAVLTAAALAPGTAAAAAPAALIQAAVQAGVTGSATAAFSSSAVALADSVVHALTVIKLKIAATAGLALAVLTTAVGFAAYRMQPAAGEAAQAQNETDRVVFVGDKPNHVWSAAISKDGKLAAAGAGWWDQPGEVGVWDLASRKKLLYAVEPKGVSFVAFSPDGSLLATAAWPNQVRLREVPSGKQVAEFKVPGGVPRVAFSPDGALLAIASEGRKVRLVDVGQREVLADLKGDLMKFHQVVFSPDGKRLFVAGGEWEKGGACQVTIWDVDGRQQAGKLLGHETAVICVTMSPDGKTIATGGVDTTIRLWNAETFAEIKVLHGHTHWVECLEFTRDGKTLVSGALDGTLRFWDVDEGRETAKLGGTPVALAVPATEPGGDAAVVAAAPWPFAGGVRAARFTPDGSTLLVGGAPRSLRLFDVATRQEIAALWEAPPPAPRPAAAPAPDAIADAPLQRELPEHYEIRFDQGLKAHPDLHLFGEGVDRMAKIEPEGLRFTVPDGRDATNEIGAEWHKNLRGDFDITLTYELIEVPQPGPQYGAGAVLECSFDAPNPPKARLARTQKNPSAHFGSTFYTYEDGKRAQHSLKYPQANGQIRTGRLRLSRTGTSLAFQVDEGGTGFRTIATYESGGADVISVRAMATTGFRPVGVDLRYATLECRWSPESKIADPNRAPERPRSRGWLSAALIVATLVVLAIAGIVALRRRRPVG